MLIAESNTVPWLQFPSYTTFVLISIKHLPHFSFSWYTIYLASTCVQIDRENLKIPLNECRPIGVLSGPFWSSWHPFWGVGTGLSLVPLYSFYLEISLHLHQGPRTSLLFAFLSPRFLVFVFWQLPKNGSIAGKLKKKNLLCLKVSLFYSQILLIVGYQ